MIGVRFLILAIATLLFAHDSPYSLKKFRPVLKISKLQAPKSAYDPLYSRGYGDFEYFSNEYFYLQDRNFMVFYMCDNHNRSELRFKNDWKVDTKTPKILEAEVKLFPLNQSREFTFLQIHADSTLKCAPTINKPLLRIVWYKRLRKKSSHLWAIVMKNTDVKNSVYEKIDLGEMPRGFFKVKIVVQNDKLKVYLNDILKLKLDVSYWDKYQNYFKAGVYLQDSGCAKVLFKTLTVKD